MEKQESKISFSTIVIISRLLRKGGPPKRLWDAVTELALLDFQENGIWVSGEGREQLRYELLLRIFKTNQIPTLSFIRQSLIWILLNLFKSGRAFPRPEISFLNISEDTVSFSIEDTHIPQIKIKKYKPQKKTLLLEKNFLRLRIWKPKSSKTNKGNKKSKQRKKVKQNNSSNNKEISNITNNSKPSQRNKIQNREAPMRKTNLQELFEKLRENLLRELPPIFARKDIEKLLPGVISARTLENLDSMGKGPKSIINGKKILYVREEFVDWLISYLREKNKVVNRW